MMGTGTSSIELEFDFETCLSFPDEVALTSYSDGCFGRGADTYPSDMPSFDILDLENQTGIEDQVFKTKNDGNKAVRLW